MIAWLLALALMLSPVAGKAVVWSDEFDGRLTAWSPRESGRQCPTQCAQIHDGVLVLSIRKVGDRFVAGQIGTEHKVEFTHGYFEAKVCYPTERGVLSAWWLAPVIDYIEGQSEVDIAENAGLRRIWHVIHWRLANMPAGTFLVERASTLVEEACHRYGVLWTALGYTFYVDRVPTATIINGLSSLPKFLVLSLKIPKYLRNKFDPMLVKEYKMRVKWVRIWQ